jgi:hypothetical protein
MYAKFHADTLSKLTRREDLQLQTGHFTGYPKVQPIGDHQTPDTDHLQVNIIGDTKCDPRYLSIGNLTE